MNESEDMVLEGSKRINEQSLQETMTTRWEDCGLTEQQIQGIIKTGYFIAPASLGHHLNHSGGLAEHSDNVQECAQKLNVSMNLGLDPKWVTMAADFHDFDKVGAYEENILKTGKQSEAKPYKWNPKLVLPHGAGGLYMLTNDLGINFPAPVAVAISWHMGEFGGPSFGIVVNKITQQPMDMLLLWLIMTADRYATWIKEVDLE